MIYTVTFNPSLDYIVSVKDFQLGKTNRTETERIVPGGKGINVSIVLSNLGIDNTALGFVAGFTGEWLLQEVEALGIRSDFMQVVQGMTRINVKLNGMKNMTDTKMTDTSTTDNRDILEGTEINGRGPIISSEKVQELLQKLEALMPDDVLVLAGSIPHSMPDDIYQEILQSLQGKGVMTVVDAAGELLRKVLPYEPFLIKPNLQELEEFFGVKPGDRQEVVAYGRKLQEMGAQNVLISMAGDGAVLLTADGQVLQASAPKGELINGVGAGDSMVAGFLAGWLARKDYSHAFRMGIAAGSASAFAEHLASKAEIEALYPKIVL